MGVRTQEKDLLVEYVQTQPGRGTMAAQILTEPFHLVAVNRHAGTVRFIHLPACTEVNVTRDLRIRDPLIWIFRSIDL